MQTFTVTIESQNRNEINSAMRSIRYMLRRIGKKSGEQIGYVILAINKETGKSRKIVSRSLA